MTERSPDAASVARIEQLLADAGLQVTVEWSDGTLQLSGTVDSEEARQAVDDIVSDAAPSATIDNQVEIEAVLPTSVDAFAGDEPTAELADDIDEITASGGELEADFTDQPTIGDPLQASGPGDSEGEDPAAGGDAVYVPPIDPVVTTDAHGRARVLGGFETETEATPEPSASDRHPGDEALADAVREKLAEDAATADLNIFVAVRHGVAHLRGQVADLDDAENAEAVAASVPGIKEVVEELEVTSI